MVDGEKMAAFLKPFAAVSTNQSGTSNVTLSLSSKFFAKLRKNAFITSNSAELPTIFRLHSHASVPLDAKAPDNTSDPGHFQITFLTNSWRKESLRASKRIRLPTYWENRPSPMVLTKPPSIPSRSTTFQRCISSASVFRCE